MANIAVKRVKREFREVVKSEEVNALFLLLRDARFVSCTFSASEWYSIYKSCIPDAVLYETFSFRCRLYSV